MKTVIEMARSVGARPQQNKNCDVEYLMDAEALECLAELVRADERNATLDEMEAMERQVNILTDALAKAKAEEREHIAQMIENAPALVEYVTNDQGGCLMCGFTPKLASAAIRNRSNT